MTTHVHTAAGEQTVDLRDPYPFFAHKRRQAAVFKGTVMDYSKTPEDFRPRSNTVYLR